MKTVTKQLKHRVNGKLVPFDPPRPFELKVAETKADVDTFPDAYVVECFNYGHDLKTRDLMASGSKIEVRARALAWVLTQPAMIPELSKLQIAAAASRSMKAVDAWLDNVASEHADEIAELD